MSDVTRSSRLDIQRLSVALFPYFAVGAIGALVWLNGIYTGDDRNTLYPVAQHSLEALVRYYIRPLEYTVVQAANAIWLPLWIVVSVVACVTASFFHLQTAETFFGKRLENPLRALVIAGNPVWFYAVSQVDTVSESLCNLTFSLALLCLIKLLFSHGDDQSNRLAIAVNVTAALLLFTKELAVVAALVLPAIAGWHQIKNRSWNGAYILSVGLLVVAFVSWLAIKLMLGGMLPESGGHYNRTPGLLDIARNTIATFSFAVTPIPSSFLSVSALTPLWVCGGIFMTLYFAWSLRKVDWRLPARRWVALAVLGTCFPMFYVHASELYASMVSGFIAAIFVMTLRSEKAACIYCAALLMCSFANCFIYYYPGLIDSASLGERRPYSVYFGPNGQYNGANETERMCAVKNTKSVIWSNGKLVCR